MLIRKYASAAAVVLTLWVLWLLWLWQPERQVRLHTTHFLKKVERRNWEAAGAFLADDFTDRWGHNKTSALQDAREVLGTFVFLAIENRSGKIERQGPEATAYAMVKISGQGGPISEQVMEMVNTLHEPFSFIWRRVGTAPWNWQLVRIDQSELNIEASSPF
jgi:hypothetical protein